MRLIRGLGKVLWFELLWKVLILVLVNPLFQDVYQTYVASVGVSFNSGVLSTFLSLKGAALFAVLFLAAAGLIFFELAVVLHILERCRRGETVSLSRVMGRAAWGLGTLGGWGLIPAALYYVLLLPLVQVGYSNSMVPSITIPWFIFGELQKSAIGQVGMVAIFVALYGLFLLLLFVPVAMALEGERFFPAVRRSLRWWRRLGWRAWLALTTMLGAWAWAATEIARYWRRNLLENTDFDRYFLKYLLYSEAFRKDLLYWLVMAVLVTAAMAAFLYAALSLLTARGLLQPVLEPRWGEDARTVLAILSRHVQAFREAWRRRLAKKGWRVAAVLICVALAGYLAAGCVRPPTLHTPVVIGHRGCIHAVENSLEAVELAGELGADYAEIDVQLSADGVPVVIHDDSLWRLAGEMTSVGDLTWAELQALTIRADTTRGLGQTASIPSLEEVIRAVLDGESGMGLLIELKPAAGRGQALVEAVTELVERYGFGDRAMFMSLDYPSVEALHAAHPEWWVGYCVFGTTGDIDESVWRYDIDFLAAEESMISNRLVMQTREQGLPLYVWSVYDTEKMLQYLEMGVSGIITDWPEEARAVADRYLASHS